jgi:hypothetical protein
MGDALGTHAGSQAGQQGSGSQAGQSGTTQQGQHGSGSQEGQNQGQNQGLDLDSLELPGRHAGESLTDYATRLHGALQTARKQAATYRTRLASSGLNTDDDEGGNQQGGGSGSQAGQNQQRNQQGAGENDRVARLERMLMEEREARKTDRMTAQLMTALANEGALNPERAMRLIDMASLNVDDDGTIDDPLGAVRELRASDPYLFGDRRGNADGGAGLGSDAVNDFNAMIRARRNGKR